MQFTMLSFHVMNNRIQFIGPDHFIYFVKCLAMNALEEWHKVKLLLFYKEIVQRKHLKKLTSLDGVLPQDVLPFKKHG